MQIKYVLEIQYLMLGLENMDFGISITILYFVNNESCSSFKNIIPFF